MSLMTYFATGISIGFLAGLLFAYSKRLFCAVLAVWVTLFLAAVLLTGADGGATTLTEDIFIFFGSMIGTIVGIQLGEEVFGR